MGMEKIKKHLKSTLQAHWSLFAVSSFIFRSFAHPVKQTSSERRIETHCMQFTNNKKQWAEWPTTKGTQKDNLQRKCRDV